MKIKELIVVEEIHDLNKLKTSLDAEIIVTHGMHLPQAVIESIQANKERGVIVFTDPDTPGDLIRQKITTVCPWIKQVHLKASEARHKRMEDL